MAGRHLASVAEKPATPSENLAPLLVVLPRDRELGLARIPSLLERLRHLLHAASTRTLAILEHDLHRTGTRIVPPEHRVVIAQPIDLLVHSDGSVEAPHAFPTDHRI